MTINRIMFFRRYQHLGKIYTQETEGIVHGKTYIFPKIDGTNAQTWFNGENLCFGSRSRELFVVDGNPDKDNAGFARLMSQDERIKAFHSKYPNLRTYGEFLIPHTLKTYREDAWKKYYIFDVVEEFNGEEETDKFRYLSYDEYQPMLEEFGLDYIMPLYIIDTPSKEQILHAMNNNIFLVTDGAGVGEGIVIKRYDFINRFGRTVWAKWVSSEFKERHYKTMGAPVVKGEFLVEKEMIENALTRTLIAKEYFKIVQEQGVWSRKMIPRLLGTVYNCIITEELWDLLKKFKKPTVDFKLLESICLAKTKEMFPEMMEEGIADFNKID